MLHHIEFRRPGFFFLLLLKQTLIQIPALTPKNSINTYIVRAPVSLENGDNCWAPVAYACNPSYSGGRDQEDCGSKPAWANSSQDPTSKIPITKRDWWIGSRCRP
jgi:hypothetical protein